MIVKELIQELQKLDQELEVFLNWDYQGPWETEEVIVRNDPEKYPDDYNMPNEWVEIGG